MTAALEARTAGAFALGTRICVVGNGATGKSTLAVLLAERLGLRYIDRDALVWREGWAVVPRPDRLALFDHATREGGWTFDGHLRAGYPDEQLVLDRCDTIVWLDFPLWRSLTAMSGRSLRRITRSEPGAGGNRERWGTLLSEHGPRAAWRLHTRLRTRYRKLFAREARGPRTLLRFISRREVNRWLAAVPLLEAA
jgi:adenylate kinase family enzyme